MAPHEHDHRKCMALFERMSEYIDLELDDATRAQVARTSGRSRATWDTGPSRPGQLVKTAGLRTLA